MPNCVDQTSDASVVSRRSFSLSDMGYSDSLAEKRCVTAQIVDLEDLFDRQLPDSRIDGQPSPELLSAADSWSAAVWNAALEAGPYPIGDADVRLGLSLATRPVFVCGVHRSGTTLVRDLLNGHPELTVLPSEGSYLTRLRAKIEPLQDADKLSFMGREWLRRLANPVSQPPYWLLGRTTEKGSPYVRFARMLMAWWRVTESALGPNTILQPLVAVALAYSSCLKGPGMGAQVHRWVDKTPTNEFFLDQLWAELPEAKVIQVIREPMAVYASRKRLEEQVFGSFMAPWEVLEVMACSLQTAIENRERRAERAFLIVRYEDLIEYPEEIMGQLALFLEIEPHRSLLRPTVAEHPCFANSSFDRGGEPGIILPAMEDRHHEALTSLEQRFVAAYTGDAAHALGYHARPTSAEERMLLKAAHRLREGLQRFRAWLS